MQCYGAGYVLLSIAGGWQPLWTTGVATVLVHPRHIGDEMHRGCPHMPALDARAKHSLVCDDDADVAAQHGPSRQIHGAAGAPALALDPEHLSTVQDRPSARMSTLPRAAAVQHGVVSAGCCPTAAAAVACWQCRHGHHVVVMSHYTPLV